MRDDFYHWNQTPETPQPKSSPETSHSQSAASLFFSVSSTGLARGQAHRPSTKTGKEKDKQNVLFRVWSKHSNLRPATSGSTKVRRSFQDKDIVELKSDRTRSPTNLGFVKPRPLRTTADYYAGKPGVRKSRTCQLADPFCHLCKP